METDLVSAAAAFTLAPVGLMVSRYRLITTCNDRFADMFGYGPAELEGASVAALYPSHDEFSHIGARWLKELGPSQRFEDQRIMKRRDGSLFWCQVIGRSLSRNDLFRECVWSFHDLSHHRSVADLTVREREVAMLCVSGATSKEIGRALGISHRTAEAHRARLMRKLGARTAAELLARIAGLPS
ncbi:LuxR C-terminal-related transcriptional regulator [Maritimibacter sp. DP1N21-5]|uniref:LuxR C-terminal-related transcriptional regulator n=1 Tax=Maritimibacter sp. DP1N21-5 TaxID=2836867 RepID=UPI00351D8647